MDDTEKISYWIEADWQGRTKSLYLGRLQGSICYTVARFRNPRMAEMFAKDWGYPLSDKAKEVIANYKEPTDG